MYVADSGIYSQANMKRLNEAKIRWVSRVPETSATAREELVGALQRQPEWQTSVDGELRWCCHQLELPQGKERWLIVSSQASPCDHAAAGRAGAAALGKTLVASASPALCLPS